MSRKPRSLKRPLILQPLIFQFATLFISVPIIVALAVRMDSGGLYTNERITPVIARAIVRDGDGRLGIRMTTELAGLRAETPDFWFVAETTPVEASPSGGFPRSMRRWSERCTISPMRNFGTDRRPIGCRP